MKERVLGWTESVDYTSGTIMEGIFTDSVREKSPPIMEATETDGEQNHGAINNDPQSEEKNVSIRDKMNIAEASRENKEFLVKSKTDIIDRPSDDKDFIVKSKTDIPDNLKDMNGLLVRCDSDTAEDSRTEKSEPPLEFDTVDGPVREAGITNLMGQQNVMTSGDSSSGMGHDSYGYDRDK